MSSGTVLDEPGNDPAWRLIQLVRSGHSFSGRERNCVFLNTHQTRFANVSAVSGLDFPDDTRAVARVDWDHDGDLDLWISNRNAPQCRFLRNDLPADDNWIAFHLEGTESNRDAIGAQVEVTFDGQPQRPIVRRLVAGDGYMTQSSKWLHVGLGASPDSCTVRVRWPSGGESKYAALKVNDRYRLVEGTSQAERVPARPRPQLPATPLELPESSDTLQVFSMVRPFLPALEYTDGQGADRNLIEMKGEPILLVLWASWCPPCVHELAELTQEKPTLDRAGLRVLALSVDHLALDAGADEGVDEVLRRLKFPFAAGRATPALLDKLQLANDFLFGLQQPLPVPTSILIDTHFRLAALYRGPLSMERLKQDLANLAVADRDRRDLTVPFAGRWADEPRTLSLAVFALELINAGFVEDASELVERTQGIYDRATILDLVVRLGMAHYERGAQQRADIHFQMARRIEPATVGPEIERGTWHKQRGEYATARQLFAEARSRNARSVPALNNLAWLLATCPDDAIRDGTQAVDLARRAARLTAARHPVVLDTLAVSLAEAGRLDEAEQVAVRAAELARAASQMNLAGQIEQRIAGFRRHEAYRELPITTRSASER